MTNQLIKKKIEIARNKLIRVFPQHKKTIRGLKLKVEKSIGYFAIDINGSIHYNEEWVDKISDEQLESALSHELEHKLVFLKVKQ